MMTKYRRTLNVSTAKGKTIVANIMQNGDQINIQIPYLSEVEIDKPRFAKDGVINFNVQQSLFSSAIRILEKYLEDLFLKGLENENRNTGVTARTQSE